MPNVRYRRSISRSAKKKRPPGRKRKDPSIDMEVESSEVLDASSTTTTEDDEQHEQSTCSKKLKLDEKDDNMNERQNLPVKLFFYMVLIDTRIFQEIIDLIGRCPE